MIFNNTQKKLILIGYLKWKTPTEIALLINNFKLGEVRPLDVHNYIQGKQITWRDLTPYCAKCNVKVNVHKRCGICERLVHGENCCTHFTAITIR